MATLSLTASLARAGRSPAIGMGAAQVACCTRAAVASTSPTLTAVGGLGSAGRQCTEKNFHSSLWTAYGTGVDVQGEAGGDDNVANPVEIEFAFDFISPYAYLAWMRTQTWPSDRVTVVPRPVLFASLLNQHGNVGPAEIPSKRRYIFVDCLRKARVLGAPLVAPPTHPFNPLAALRVASIDGISPAQRTALVTEIFSRIWGGKSEEGVETVDTALDAAEEVGIDRGMAVAGMEAAKETLKATTADMTGGRGVFGVPTLMIPGIKNYFWGYDSLPFVEGLLFGDDRKAGEGSIVAAWAAAGDESLAAHGRAALIGRSDAAAWEVIRASAVRTVRSPDKAGK